MILVSCICPTAGRREFLRAAIAQFRAQAYPAKRLIVVEDGPGRNEDLIPTDGSAVYLHLGEEHHTIGEKRNAACGLATPGLIAHWDDDDWNHPQRLAVQIAALRRAGGRVCGTDRLLFHDGTRAWIYRPHDPGWIAGGTLIYDRAVWTAGPFLPRSNGEDTLFVRAAYGRDEPVVRIPNERLYIARIHPGNSVPKDTHDPQWLPYDSGRVRGMVRAWGAIAGVTPEVAT